MKISRIMRSTHQGLGLLIGIQVVLWISGGVVMSVLPIEKVRGEDWVAENETSPLPADLVLLAPDRVARDLGLSPLDGADLGLWLDTPVYRLDVAGKNHLADAVTGELISPLDENQARKVALRDYAGPGSVAKVSLQEKPLLEIRGRDLPQWRIDFDDSRHTTVYVSPQSGKVTGRRNQIWQEAKSRGAEQGSSVDWGVIISRTNEVIQREFADQISGFVSGNDAVLISERLNTSGK